MARRGENIFKRKDGRWEARYVSGKMNLEKQGMLPSMEKVIGR